MTLPELISDLAIILLTAGIVTVIFKKIRQPLVLGYIAAGFLIGPYMPLFFTVADMESIETWSEIGIIILMFGLGLEFNLHKLISVGGTAVITALTEVGGMLVLGCLAGQAMGWGMTNSIFLGGMLSMSSTTVIIKAFDELGVRGKSFAELVFGTLVVEDIAGIFMMIVLSTISVSQSISGAALALKLGMLVLYLVLWLILGIYLLPTLLNKASPLMNDETLLIVSLGICFGMVLLADALGFSSALGAFLAGSLLAGTVHAERVEKLSSGVKDLFGSVFFVSVGMMIDPAVIAEYILPIVIITLVTLVGKLIFSSLGVLVSGQSLKNAVHCGCSLAQIGEFAFIIASLGLSIGVTSDYLYPIIVSVSVITTLTTPFFIRGADKFTVLVERILPSALVEKLNRETDEDRRKREQDSDWAVYLRRYVKITALYGIIMLGITLIGGLLLYPLLGRLIPSETVCACVSLAAIYFGIALFVRPMLELHSTEYTALWVRSVSFRLPLMALTAIRLILIVLIAFLPLQNIAGLSSLWLLPIIVAAIFLLSRFGWLHSAYLNVRTQFIANFNERQLALASASDGSTEWLDEALSVMTLLCPAEAVSKSLSDLGWGRSFSVNVIKIVHGRRHRNMPTGRVVLNAEDILYVIGETENLRNLRLSLGLGDFSTLPTLRDFITAQTESGHELYTYAITADRGSQLAGSTIKDSGIRENYGCMILGLQRGNLPIVQPHIDRHIHAGDLVWVLGDRSMAEKLISDTSVST